MKQITHQSEEEKKETVKERLTRVCNEQNLIMKRQCGSWTVSIKNEQYSSIVSILNIFRRNNLIIGDIFIKDLPDITKERNLIVLILYILGDL